MVAVARHEKRPRHESDEERPMTEPPAAWIERRTRSCQALIETAEPTAALKFVLGQSMGVPLVGGLAAGKVLEISRKWTGGTWVGGAAYLTEDAVSFFPSTLETLGYKNLEPIRAPLEEVRAVRTATKLMLPAVALDAGEATLWLAILWKPKAFADAVRAAVATRASA